MQYLMVLVNGFHTSSKILNHNNTLHNNTMNILKDYIVPYKQGIYTRYRRKNNFLTRETILSPVRHDKSKTKCRCHQLYLSHCINSNILATYGNSGWINWPLFCRRYFQLDVFCTEIADFDKNFIESYSEGSNQQLTNIGSDNGQE